jgi:RNA polymerase sigma-70 factor (ECF subfamily)
MHKPSLVLKVQYSEASDEDLVNRIGRGDRLAEAQLATRYRDSLVRLGERHGLAEDAEDFANDALVCLLKKLRAGTIDEPAKVGAYLTGIAVNLWIADRRKKARRQTFADSDAVARIAADSVSPLRASSNAENERIIRILLGHLPRTRDSAILYRHYILDEDKMTICAALDFDARLFHRVLHRARRRLKAVALDHYPELAASG